jgi:hypothetical protein
VALALCRADGGAAGIGGKAQPLREKCRMTDEMRPFREAYKGFAGREDLSRDDRAHARANGGWQ